MPPAPTVEGDPKEADGEPAKVGSPEPNPDPLLMEVAIVEAVTFALKSGTAKSRKEKSQMTSAGGFWETATPANKLVIGSEPGFEAALSFLESHFAP